MQPRFRDSLKPVKCRESLTYMNKQFLTDIALAYGYIVQGDWFCAYPINGESLLRPLSSLDEYLKTTIESPSCPPS